MADNAATSSYICHVDDRSRAGEGYEDTLLCSLSNNCNMDGNPSLYLMAS